MMVTPHLPVDDVETDVMHNDGRWYLFGVDDGDEIRDDWIQTDKLWNMEEYR